MAGFRITDCVAQRAPGRLIRRIEKLMAALIEDRLQGTSLSFVQWATLKLVQDGQAVTAGDLARELDHTTGATTRLIDSLEIAGLLTRDRTSDDRRVVRLAVTPAGAEAIDAIRPIVADLWNEMVADFDQAEADQLVESLIKLLAAIEAKAAVRAPARAAIQVAA